MACAAAGAAVISKSAGTMFSNDALPADEALLRRNGRRTVERVDVSSKTPAAPNAPPSDASSVSPPPS